MKQFSIRLGLLLWAVLMLAPGVVGAQPTELGDKIAALLQGKRLRAGIALCDLATGDTLTMCGGERFPMMSVFKFPLALSILHDADAGCWSLSDTLRISKGDLPDNTWSPLRDRSPEGGVYTIAELLQYTVSLSDNNGCDILLRLSGSPTNLNDYVHSLGIDGIAIARTEADMHRDPQTIHDNYSTPRAMLQLVRLFEGGSLLKSDTQAFLQQTMAETSTGSVRKLLPEGTVVAHKTGSSGRDAQGIAAATNDAGILHLPSGQRIAYVIFLADSAESDEETYDLIARIAQIIYNEYSNLPLHE